MVAPAAVVQILENDLSVLVLALEKKLPGACKFVVDFFILLYRRKTPGCHPRIGVNESRELLFEPHFAEALRMRTQR